MAQCLMPPRRAKDAMRANPGRQGVQQASHVEQPRADGIIRHRPAVHGHDIRRAIEEVVVFPARRCSRSKRMAGLDDRDGDLVPPYQGKEGIDQSVIHMSTLQIRPRVLGRIAIK